MNHKLAFVVIALLVPAAAGCGDLTANPIGGSTSNPTNTGAGGGPASMSGTGGGPANTGTGGGPANTGTGGGPASGGCAPGCGTAEVCVESACHALVTLDSANGGNGCTIVVDATSVYWATGEVRIVPKAGGPGTGFNAWVPTPALAVDDTYLYFNAGNGGIARAAKTGKSGFTPFAGQSLGSAKQMVGDGTTLYYLDEMAPPAVYAMPTAAPPGTEPTVFATNLYGIGTVAVDATSVYYWDGGGLVKQDKTTHVVTPFADMSGGFGFNIGDSSALAVDGATVYFSSTPLPGQGAVVATASGPNDLPKVVVDAAGGLTGVFAIDATHIYYMTFEGVMRVAKTGGSPVAVGALSPPSPFATCMAVDDTYVYWVDGLSLRQYKK